MKLFFFYNGCRCYLKHYGTKFIALTVDSAKASIFSQDAINDIVEKKLQLKDRQCPIYWLVD